MGRFKQRGARPAFTFDSYDTRCDKCVMQRAEKRGEVQGRRDEMERVSQQGDENEDGVRGLQEMRRGDGWK